MSTRHATITGAQIMTHTKKHASTAPRHIQEESRSSALARKAGWTTAQRRRQYHFPDARGQYSDEGRVFFARDPETLKRLVDAGAVPYKAPKAAPARRGPPASQRGTPPSVRNGKPSLRKLGNNPAWVQTGANGRWHETIPTAADRSSARYLGTVWTEGKHYALFKSGNRTFSQLWIHSVPA
ncbi:MAG: hypothetical protein ACHREM_08760 [Polyangiales bacterium]